MKYENVYSYKTNNGIRYMYRVHYYSYDGKRHEKQKRGFTTARLAYRASLEALMAIEDSRVEELNAQTMTVNGAIKYYMKANEGNFSPATLEMKKRVFNKIHDTIGKKKVISINAINYKQMMLDLYGGMSQNAIFTYHAMIVALFNWLVDNDLLDKNRIRKVFRPTKSNRNKIMSPKELEKFLSVLEKRKQTDPVIWYALNFLLRAGCRRGELMALAWEDITDDGQVHIHKTRRVDDVKQTTKTGNDRTIYIGKTLLGMHKYYKQFKLKQYLKNGKSFNKKDFVLTDNNLYRIPATTLTRGMDSIQKECGFTEHYTIHSLRHANATYSLSSDNNIKAVQSRLGHANSRTTMKYYVEDLDYVNKQYADDIDVFFDNI